MLTTIGIGAAVSCVILGVYVWGRFAVPERFAPLVGAAAFSLWGYIMGRGLLDMLANLP